MSGSLCQSTEKVIEHRSIDGSNVKFLDERRSDLTTKVKIRLQEVKMYYLQ